VFVNYDGFRISEDTYDEYAEMDRYMLEQYYTQITRFATSAFMRMKLGQAFTRRDIAPHVFENKDDAHDFLASLDAQQHQSSDDGALRMRVPRCLHGRDAAAMGSAVGARPRQARGVDVRRG